MDASGIEGDDGLVVDLEFLALESSSQIRIELQKGQNPIVHGAIEYLIASSTFFFGPIHGDIGISENIFGQFVAIRPQNDANTGIDKNFVGIDMKGTIEKFEQLLGQIGGLANIPNVIEDDGEFIATQSR